MSKLLGFGLILAGIVIGGVGVPLSASSLAGRDGPAQAAPAASPPASGDSAGKRAFAGPALKPLAAPIAAVTGSDAASARDLKAPGPKAAEPHPALRPPAAPAARKPIVPAFETVTLPEDPAAVTRAVQAELGRVGCYRGPVTGVWGPETRRAMKVFTNRVNATLPVDKPDVILLSLLASQPAGSCGMACPSGQEGGADGRCVPKAVVAQAARKANPAAPKVAAAREHAVVPRASVPPAAVVIVPPAAPAAPPKAASAPPVVAVLAPVYSDPQRMALGVAPAPDAAAPAASPAAVPAAAPPEKQAAKHVRKRKGHAVAEGSVRYGQTRWAREFYNKLMF